MSAEREHHSNDPGDIDERDRAMREPDDDGPFREEASTATAMGGAMAGTAPAGAGPQDPLLPGDRLRTYRDRWEQIQVRFVDEPQSSVEQADRLVLDVIQQLQSSFAAERESLEGQWQRGDDVDTEQLRMALQRYRSFFHRLLAA
ncbi:MAG TPA: hypothetical protein VF129_01150 [Actinomycetota bacterium]